MAVITLFSVDRSAQDFLKGMAIETWPVLAVLFMTVVIKTTFQEKKIAISQGIMNLIAPVLGGVPMCHGAGGMAGHVRFGAKTGVALVILGSILVLIALFFSDSVALFFKIFSNAILGVILFFAGSELAIVVKDIGDKKSDFYVMLIVVALSCRA